MSIWTLEYNGVEKRFDEWGLSNLQRKCVSQACDVVKFKADGEAFDADETFAYGSSCLIRKDGVGWFYGRVTKIPRAGSGAEESMDYELAGPWWYLESQVFQQLWMVKNDSTGILESTLKSRIILGQKLIDEGYTKANLGEVLAEVLNYPISHGAPIQIGTIVPDMVVPYWEVQDRTCAELVKDCLKWCPDAVTFFDYSTTPPTLHILRRGDCSVASLSVGNGESVSQLKVIPRHELRVPCVVLKYEAVNQRDDVSWSSVTVDKYPDDATGTEFGGIVMTLELSGSAMTTQKQEVKTENMTPDSINWWKDFFPWLSGASESSVSNVTLEGTGSSMNRVLVSGSCPSWLKDQAGDISIKADLSYSFSDSATGRSSVYKNEKVSINLTATNLDSKVYSRVTSATQAEPIPVGLARNFYETLSVLQYDGNIKVIEEECSGQWHIGKLLNLLDGRNEWETMQAQIQSVNEDIDSGITQIKFGPAEHLSPQDIVELLRVNRGHTPSWKLDERSNGESSGKGGKVEGGGMTALKNGSKAGTGQTKLVLADSGNKLTLSADTSDGGATFWGDDVDGYQIKYINGKLQIYYDKSSEVYIDLSVDDVWDACTAPLISYPLNIRFRELDVCLNGTPAKMLFLASQPYNAT